MGGNKLSTTKCIRDKLFILELIKVARETLYFDVAAKFQLSWYENRAEALDTYGNNYENEMKRVFDKIICIIKNAEDIAYRRNIQKLTYCTIAIIICAMWVYREQIKKLLLTTWQKLRQVASSVLYYGKKYLAELVLCSQLIVGIGCGIGIGLRMQIKS